MYKIFHFFPELYKKQSGETGLGKISKANVNFVSYVSRGHVNSTLASMKRNIDSIVRDHNPKKLCVGKTNKLYTRKNYYGSYKKMFSLYKTGSKDFQSMAEVELIAYAKRKYPHLVKNITNGSPGRNAKEGPYYVYVVIT